MIAHSEIPLIAVAGRVPDQIAFVVEDLSTALRRWGVTAADDHWRIWTYGPTMIEEQTYLGEPADYSMLLAMNGTRPQLELVQPLDGPSIYHTWRNAGRTGVHHLGYYVDDIDEVIGSMQDAGFACVQTGARYGADGTGKFAYFDTVEALGFYLEGIQVPTERRAPESVWPEGGRR